jgi:hypothetical protein
VATDTVVTFSMVIGYDELPVESSKTPLKVNVFAPLVVLPFVER